jgi:dTDP-glucose 4,6-dehydratase
MKILVTGGSGFIGANYIHHVLSSTDDEVINLDKLTYAGNEATNVKCQGDARYRFIHGDICDFETVEPLVQECDAVMHFGAESHVDRSILGPREFIQTNLVGTATLLEAARKHDRRFHHISTDEVFGSLGESGLFSESTPYDPRSPYSASKAGSDHLVRAYYHTYNLPVTISNCTNNYGPWHFPEKLIPLCITHLIDHKKVPVYGKGENIRDWIFVEDHVAGLDLALRNGKIGETYCFGGNAEATNIDLVKMILAEFGFDETMIEFVKDRKGHDFRYAMDSSKALAELGWQPKTDLKSGLEQTITWFKKNEDWWRPLQERLIKNITA